MTMVRAVSYLLFAGVYSMVCHAKQDAANPLATSSGLKNKRRISPEPFNNNLLASKKLCHGEMVQKGTFIRIRNGSIYLPTINRTIDSPNYYFLDKGICLLRISNKTPEDSSLFLDCKYQILHYEPEDYTILSNGSIMLANTILGKGSYQLLDNQLQICSPENAYDEGNSTGVEIDPLRTDKILIDIGIAGSILSIFALTFHILVFALIPSMQNLPGFNLASLSVAFWMAYFFALFGQIPSILGTSCIISACFQHFFFLSGFFWMNVIAFDVWRTLRLATQRLVAPSNKVNLRKFLFYSIYAWGIPFCLAATAIAMDLSNTVSDEFKPRFGQNQICWFNNKHAIKIFFIIPAFSVFIANAIFFILSACTVIRHTMKDPSDHQRVAKNNFVLYVRLGIIMGITWLLAIAGVFSKSKDLWFAFDILNSLQGVYVFLFFSCSRKVLNHLNDKLSCKKKEITRDSSTNRLALRNSTVRGERQT